jgi:hypothetical protein
MPSAMVGSPICSCQREIAETGPKHPNFRHLGPISGFFGLGVCVTTASQHRNRTLHDLHENPAEIQASNRTK